MKVLVVGGGGREHAMTWKLARSESVTELYAAPGNAGIASIATCVDISADDVEALARYAASERFDLVAVGPEVPLCRGLVDHLTAAGITAFGPSSAAAQIEGSKVFSKRLMRKYDIPTAAFGDFTDAKEAGEYARSLGGPMWIKASGLAAGKGAVFAADPDAAERIVREMMVERAFGVAGESIVIEEHLVGEEASIFALCDGETYRLLVSSQDHKRAFDGDTGPNTGGMGAYAPAPVVTPALLKRIEAEIIQPTINGMAAEGMPYRGLLYTGVVLTAHGPSTLEFNCRFGDPETQVVLPLLDDDLAEIMTACATGTLGGMEVRTAHGAALCVVIASGGYPDKYRKGLPVHGLEDAAAIENVMVFHAGTQRSGDDVLTSGGRVFGVTSWGDGFLETRSRAYEAAGLVRFEDSFYRNDIGNRALKYFTSND